jgi:uncharacterized protein YxeA
MKKIIIITVVMLLMASAVVFANHLIDNQASWTKLHETDQLILKYIEEQEMGGAHITVTFTTFSTAHMERVTARTQLGL